MKNKYIRELISGYHKIKFVQKTYSMQIIYSNKKQNKTLSRKTIFYIVWNTYQ